MTNPLTTRRRVPGQLLPAAGAALLALGGCGEAPAVDESADMDTRRVINVEVEILAPRPFTDMIRLTGTVNADREVTVAAEEGGTVSAILDDKGDKVRLGQALVRLDDELLRAEVQFTNLETRLILARNQVAAARGRLLVVLGVDPLQAVAVTGSLSELQLAPGAVNSDGNADLLAASGAVALAAMTEEELRQAAFTLRSDLRQLRTSEKLSEVQVEVQEREVLPVIRAFGSLDFRVADNDEDDVFGSLLGGSGPERYSQWDLSASAGLSIQVPVFSGFSRSARLEQRREELHIVTSRLRQAELDMVNQVHTLAASMREARARAASQRVAIVQSQRGYDIATARYRAGVGSQFEVVAAETTLREAEFNYAQAVYDYLSTASRLEVATGQVPLVDRAASSEGTGDG